jgi:hypothetical protein
MSPGNKPPFALKPPARSEPKSDRLGALEALQAWTEKRDEGDVAVAEAPVEVALTPSTAAASSTAVKPSKATRASKARIASTASKGAPDSFPVPAPWATPEEGRTQLNYRVDVQLYNKMKYLAGTTMGMDMTKLMNEILEPEVNRRLRERGFDV